MNDAEIRKLFETGAQGIELQPETPEDPTEAKLNKAREALRPHLEKMQDDQRKRVENAMHTLRLFKPAYYSNEAYEYQCVLPLTRTLLEIGEELGREG
ncbi:MAG: hypothetical protein K6G16_09550 [Lachnospiraceae bacterium]|nr:hypothetical protein [Lachnospiraceae bacterium]